MADNNTKTGPGRPSKITPEVLAKLQQAFLMECTEEEACALAKIDPATLWRYKQRHPEFCKEIEAYKLNPKIKARATIYKNLDKPKVAQWYLERKLKDEFSTKQIIEDVSKTGEQKDKLDELAAAISSLSQDVKSNPSQQS